MTTCRIGLDYGCSVLSLLPLQDGENSCEVVGNILSLLKSTVGNRVGRGMVGS